MSMASRMEQNGAVVLVKKREAKVADAKGIKIFPCRPNGSPDYAAGAQIVWIGDLKGLLEGKCDYVPAYFSPALVKQNGGA